PNNKSIRVGPWSYRCQAAGSVPDFAPFFLYQKSYITISDFTIRGSAAPVVIRGNGTANIVDRNQIIGPQSKVEIQGAGPGSDEPTGTIVRNNSIFDDAIGFNPYYPLAKGDSIYPLSMAREVSDSMYNINKYVIGYADSVDFG